MGASIGSSCNEKEKEPQAWREIGGAFAVCFAFVGAGTLLIFGGSTLGKCIGGGMLAFSAGWFLLVGKVPL